MLLSSRGRDFAQNFEPDLSRGVPPPQSQLFVDPFWTPKMVKCNFLYTFRNCAAQLRADLGPMGPHGPHGAPMGAHGRPMGAPCCPMGPMGAPWAPIQPIFPHLEKLFFRKSTRKSEVSTLGAKTKVVRTEIRHILVPIPSRGDP